MRLFSLISRLLLSVAAATAIAASPAAAQGQGGGGEYAGQWTCKFSMEPFNKQPIDTHYWEFAIALQPGGAYQMQGFYYSPFLGYQVPVQGQGNWSMTNNGPRGLAVSVQGQLYRQDNGWHPFQFMVTPADARNLYFQFRGNTHNTNITCQR